MELKELELSDQERIDKLILDIMGDAKAGSGFMLMPTAAPISMPLAEKTEQNYIQMIESAHKYGKYGGRRHTLPYHVHKSARRETPMDPPAQENATSCQNANKDGKEATS